MNYHTNTNIIRLDTAVTLIQSGKIIAYPTEAIYGLGCDPMNQAAVQKIFDYKQRPTHKQFILIASEFDQLAHYVGVFENFSLEIQAKIKQKSPGFHTWIVPSIPTCPAWLLGENANIAVRISTHPIVKQLCDQVGALISTSANISGKASATSIEMIQTYFGIDFPILYGDLGNELGSSPIQDLFSGEYLRQ